MFAITANEKKNSAKYVETMLNSFINTSDGIETLKIIINYVAKTSSKQSDLRNIDDTVFKDSKLTANYLEKAINYMIEVAAESDKCYSTGELAKYFGVSVTAINKWVNENRFIGVKRTERNQQLRILEDTLWKSSQGDLIPIKDIVKMYGENTRVSKDEEIKYIMEEIKFFEKKYEGSFQNTLAHKEDLSSDEETDASEWLYLLKRINK